MTLITFQDGKPVMRDGKVGTGQGCCCGGCGEPCSRCNQSCLSLTIEGFAGPTGQQCSECDGVNGTYTLSRGTGAPPSIRASIQDTTGTGAVIAATLGYQPSDGSYTITKASINKKGTCYTKNAAFAYTLDGASVACDDEPVVAVEVERTEPLLNFGAIGDRFAPLGTGASLQPSFTPVATTPGAQTWGISSVSVTAGGTNYDDYSPISIKTKGCTVTIRPAVASIRTPRDQPIETVVFVDSKTGSGAVLDLQWEEFSLPENQYHPAGAVAWRATGATILSGGSGYTADDVVKYTLDSSHRYASGSPDPIILAQGSLTIPLYELAFSNIGPGGSLVGVIGTDWPFDLTNDSLFWYRGNNGAIQSVTVTDGGEYYTPGGIASLTIQDGGTFWPDEPCNYGYCGPSACKVNGETQCRQLSVNIGNNDRKLTISSDSGVLIQATVPADGYPCDGITFASKEITSSCATVGTITLTGATCSGPSQDSCCRGACCVDGACDPTKATAEQCAAAGGQWHPGKTCNDLCWCCSYRYICFEEVLIAKEGSWPRIQEGTEVPWLNDVDDIPTEQPPGTLFVWALSDEPPFGNIYGCAGTPGIKMYANGSGETQPDGPCGEPGNYRFILQVYYRARIVDSCDECAGVEQEWEYPDGRVFCCDNDGNYHPNVTSCEDCPGWSPENINPARCWTTQGEILSARAGMSCSPLTQYSCANQIPPGIPWSSCLEAAGISICANPLP